MTTAAKKKTKAVIQSTDRGGVFILPFSVALLTFGLMMLLGAMLQTTAGVLNLFKYLAIGLSGGLYLLLPLMVIWLAVLLMISSKRYVSMYAYIISFLLFLCLGALMTLTLRVNDQSYPRLMDYIRNINSLRGVSYPDSMGAYLNSAYHRYSGLRSDNGLYPGGGALSMLIAYPLFAMLGNFGAVTVLVLASIALVFALLRVSPVKLVQQLSDRLQHVPRPEPRPVQQNTRQATEAVYQQPQPVQEFMPDSVYEVQEQVQAQWPSQQPVVAYEPVQEDWYFPQQQQAIQPEPAVEPGFVQQSGTQLMEEFVQPTFQPAPVQARRGKPVKPVVEAVNEPVKKPDYYEPVTATVKAEPAVQEQPDLPWEEAPQPIVEHAVSETKTISSPEPEPAAISEQAAPSVQHPKPVSEKPRQETYVEKPAKPVGIAPAVPLTGERVAVRKSTETFAPKSLDGMAASPDTRQLKLNFDDYTVPPLRLLAEAPEEAQLDTTEEDRARAQKLIETLKSFSITASLHDIVHGPTVTRFAIRLAEGVNVSKLRNVMDNLTIELRAKGDIRAEMPIPGTSFVGLEVSNDKTSKVYLRDVLESSRMKENKSPTAVALGKDITGTPIVSELMDMPHLLIAGATGSGKSVCINSIICSILYRASPRNVRLIMVDPKFVELQPYNDVPHLMMPVITDAKKATSALDWVCQEMDRRYQVMVEAGVRNLDAYNKKLSPDEEPLPRIIVIVDEMADLMTTNGKMIEDHIKRITAKARAAGICLILATQRPSVNIITGVIKANIPGRIAFRVSSPFDSKTILDSQGAEKLLGYGDMLYRSMTRDPIRVQGCFVSDQDVEETVEYIRSRNKAEYNLDLMEFVEKPESGDNGGSMDNADAGDGEFDELLPQAIEMAVEAGQMSISMLQRVLRVGYARSGRLIDEMTRRGIISGNEGTKPRKTLMTREQYMSYLEHGS